MTTNQRTIRWQTPEQLVHFGFSRSRVVLMNEAHNGWLRSVRTREVGRRILPVAHAGGVRHLAMEALADRELVEESNRRRSLPEVPSPSYLAQSEMRAFIQDALDLGWTLIGYEADMTMAQEQWDPLGDEFTNWREEQQATNLARALEALPSETKILVWCGNGHLYKRGLPEERLTGLGLPMGARLWDVSGIEPFAIDQIQTVEFGQFIPTRQARFLRDHTEILRALGGTAGFLRDEAPEPWVREDVDALLLSLENRME